MRYSTYLLFGPPGSGKGTIGATLGRIPRLFQMACGEVFRSLDTRTPLGQQFISFAGRGLLVPDELTIQLWMERIGGAVGAHSFKPDIDHLVLDGIPRNERQAELMESMIEVKRVFYLECADRDELVALMRKRALKESRFDDANEKTIRRRLSIFEAESQPLLEFYGRDRITRVDAERAPARVLLEVLDAIVADDQGAFAL